MGGIADLTSRLQNCRLVALDSMIIAYHFADAPRYAPLTQVIFDALEAGQLAGMTTTITLAEVLTAPAKLNNQEALQSYEIYLSHFPNLQLVPVDTALARETALVRAATGLRTPDAVNVAAARLAGAAAIITNDHRWVGKVAQPALILLSDYLA